jgi:hypothetical protein
MDEPKNVRIETKSVIRFRCGRPRSKCKDRINMHPSEAFLKNEIDSGLCSMAGFDLAPFYLRLLLFVC